MVATSSERVDVEEQGSEGGHGSLRFGGELRQLNFGQDVEGGGYAFSGGARAGGDHGGGGAGGGGVGGGGAGMGWLAEFMETTPNMEDEGVNHFVRRQK